MITQERFEEIYKKASTIFEPEDEQVPVLEIREDCPEEEDDRIDPPDEIVNKNGYPIIEPTKRILDLLGYFSCKSPDRLYLCKKRIEKFAQENNCDVNVLAEIVAVHEIGHYIHCKLNKTFCTEVNVKGDSFYNFRKYFVESFAQLLTHRFCIDENENYSYVFNKLKEGQTSWYTKYSSFNHKLGGCLKECPKSILEKVFKTDLERKKKDGTKDAEKDFIELFINEFKEYFENENEAYVDESGNFNQGLRDDVIGLSELGLSDDFSLKNLNHKFKFILEDPCCRNQ
jgi:hypothetical protein